MTASRTTGSTTRCERNTQHLLRLCGRRYAGVRRLGPLPLELRGDEDYEIETIVEEPATRAASRKEPEGG